MVKIHISNKLREIVASHLKYDEDYFDSLTGVIQYLLKYVKNNSVIL